MLGQALADASSLSSGAAQAAANSNNGGVSQVQGTSTTQQTTATGQLNVALASTTPTAVPLSGLAVEISAQSQAGHNRFEIRLDPPELGQGHAWAERDQLGADDPEQGEDEQVVDDRKDEIERHDVLPGAA